MLKNDLNKSSSPLLAIVSDSNDKGSSSIKIRIMASPVALISDPSKLIEKTSQRRLHYIDRQIKEARKLIDRLAKLDPYAYFSSASELPTQLDDSSSSNSNEPPIRNLYDLLPRLEPSSQNYISPAPFSEFKWQAFLSDIENILSIDGELDLHDVGNSKTGLNLTPSVSPTMMMLTMEDAPNSNDSNDGNALTIKQENPSTVMDIVESRDNLTPNQMDATSGQQASSSTAANASSALTSGSSIKDKSIDYAKKMLRVAKESVQLKIERQEKDLKKIWVEECIDRISEVNREPAMSSWRKEPIPKRPYKEVPSYVPAEGLSTEEGQDILDKLVVSKHFSTLFDENMNSFTKNQWVLPDGLDELEIWSQVIKLDREARISGIDNEDWKGLSLHNGDIIETDTWGMDCFTRRNLEFALYFVEESKRFNPLQLRYFIEFCLPRAINQQDKQVAHNIQRALPYLIENADKFVNEMVSSLPENIYDSNITAEQIVAAAKMLQYVVPNWGEHNFAIHPKGVGVISKIVIKAGQYITPYFGELYPCWLWEQKESFEDMERKRARESKTGNIILPDFWNMRLELPMLAPSGFDLLHIDAKRAGNFSSRMSHSCRPNCGTMTAVINGTYCVAMRSLREIQVGEELTIDYNCVTDSVDEYRAAVCLCGSHDCRGSFLYIAGAKQLVDIAQRSQSVLHRVGYLVEASKRPTSNVSFLVNNIKDDKGDNTSSAPDQLLSKSTSASSFSSGADTLSFSKKSRYKKADNISTTNLERFSDGIRQMIPEECWSDIKSSPLLVTLSFNNSPKFIDFTLALSQEESTLLVRNGIKRSALHNLPDWCSKFSALALSFAEGERMEFPSMLLAKERSPGEPENDIARWESYQLQAGGLITQRLSTLVTSLDKVRHFMNERVNARLWWVGDRCFVSKSVIKSLQQEDNKDNYEIGTIVGFMPFSAFDMSSPRSDVSSGSQASSKIGYFVMLDSQVKLLNQAPLFLSGRDLYPLSSEKTLSNARIERPLIGLDSSHHQPPFRLLSEEEVIYMLWNDKINGVAARCISAIDRKYQKPISVWQIAYDKNKEKLFWWNFITREVKEDPPSIVEQYEMTSFTPSSLPAMWKFLSSKTPKTLADTQAALATLRTYILELPVVGNRLLNDQHQKAVDLLALLSNTKNFFVMNEIDHDNINYASMPSVDPEWRSSPLAHPLIRSSSQQEDKKTTNLNMAVTSIILKEKRKRTKMNSDMQESTLSNASVIPSHRLAASFAEWIGKEEGDEVEMSKLVGSALLPTIESCYDDDTELGYNTCMRQILLNRLSPQGAGDRNHPWPKCLVKSFPNAGSLPSFSNMSRDKTEEPFRIPPLQLFGSPFLDAAIIENEEYIEKCRQVRESKKGKQINDKKKIEKIEIPLQSFENNSKSLSKIATVLNNSTRNPEITVNADKKLITPPKAPSEMVTTWVQCELPECGKWRKLPPNVKADLLPDIFQCSHLYIIDPSHASCSAEEEPYDDEIGNGSKDIEVSGSPKDDGNSVITTIKKKKEKKATARLVKKIQSTADSQTSLLDLNMAIEGMRIDAFDVETMLWVRGTIVETRTDAVKVRLDLTIDQKHFLYNVFLWTSNTYVTFEDGEERVYREEWVRKKPQGINPETDEPIMTSGLAPYETELAILYSHTKKSAFDIEFERKEQLREEEEKKRKKDFAMQQEFDRLHRERGGVELSVEEEVQNLMSLMISKIVKDEISRKKLEQMDPSKANLRNSPLSRNAFFNFFEATRKIDPLCPFVRILGRWKAMNESQQRLWEKHQTSKKSTSSSRGEPDKISFSQTQVKQFIEEKIVNTPIGEGFVLPNSSKEGYLSTVVALRPKSGVRVRTPYGFGEIIDHNEQTGKVIVELEGWKGKLHTPHGSIVARVALCQPDKKASASNKVIEDDEELEVPNGVHAKKHSKKQKMLGSIQQPSLLYSMDYDGGSSSSSKKMKNEFALSQ